MRLFDCRKKGIHVKVHDDSLLFSFALFVSASVVSAEFAFWVHRFVSLHPDFIERPGGVALVIGKLEEIGGGIEHGEITNPALPDIGFPGAGHLLDFDRPAVPAKPQRLYDAVFEYGNHVNLLFNILVHGDIFRKMI